MTLPPKADHEISRYRWRLPKSVRRLLRDRTGTAALLLVIATTLVACFASHIAPFDSTEIMTGPVLGWPTSNNWLGTDNLGRDILSRTIYGTQISMLTAGACVSLALVVGLTLGLIAGLGPVWLDNAIMVVLDTIRSFPTIVMGLAASTMFGSSIFTVILIISLATIPTFGRVARTQAMVTRGHDYILAERAMGAGLPRIASIHILPNIIGPLLILASMEIPTVITLEAGLSFLGVGVPPPASSWGNILNDGFSVVRNTPWPIVASGLPLIIITLAFTFLGESLRDTLDPKLAKDI
jgi:peptide/nickel transport system permease protein